ncbi:hypothetical protein [Pseudomonas sp. 1152_12]|uniref:hypothetical protein n=1 Tax=Pseudomonas sp. 1152_12 TaxID=2604455 RepID=UPI00406309F6
MGALNPFAKMCAIKKGIGRCKKAAEVMSVTATVSAVYINTSVTISAALLGLDMPLVTGARTLTTQSVQIGRWLNFGLTPLMASDTL